MLSTVRLVALAFLTVILSGCIYVSGHELPRREVPSPTDATLLIATEVGTIELLRNNEPSGRAISASNIGRSILDSVLGGWQERGLIKGFGAPGELEEEADFTLRIEGEDNEQSSTLAYVAAPLSLFLIPSSVTFVYDWSFELTDQKTGERFLVTTKYSVTQWNHITLVLALPMFWIGIDEANRDLAAYLFDEFAKQGAWLGASTDLVKELQRLDRLHRAGELTDEEFRARKSRLLR